MKTMPPSALKPHAFPMSIDARWGTRAESPSAVAARLVETVRGLKPLHPALARWYPNEKNGLTWPKKHPLNPDDPGAVLRAVERLGYVAPFGSMPGGTDLTCWNGTVDGHDIFLLCSVGTVVDGLENYFKVSWGIFSPADTTLLKNRVLTERIMEIVVDAWHPDWCQVAGSYAPDLGPNAFVNREWMVPEVGWLLYVAGRRLCPRDVPSAHHVRSMGKDGTLIAVSDQMIGTCDPVHWALSNRVREEVGLPFPYSVTGVPELQRIPPPEVLEKLHKPDAQAAELLRELEAKERRRRRGRGRKNSG